MRIHARASFHIVPSMNVDLSMVKQKKRFLSQETLFALYRTSTEYKIQRAIKRIGDFEKVVKTGFV